MILIGVEDSKRTDYMRRAAAQENIPLQLLPWDALRDNSAAERLPQAALQNKSISEGLPGNTLHIKSILESLQGTAVKIDPPEAQTFQLDQMNEMLAEYRTRLERLSEAECRFLNTPEAICRLLDKRDAKKHLHKQCIPVTEMFPEEASDAEQLLEVMKHRQCYSVFIKPRYFSGAAGVAALRIHPVRGKLCLYTSCRLKENHLINTKKLFRIDSRREVFSLLDRLLSLDCVVERWHPKADFHGKSYDLRVVYQFGHIACVVARQSSGPITNLHLNNQAMPVQALGLKAGIMDEIEEICSQALSAFHGLSMAGVDVLLERGTLRPRIIEMNGQGDLIYQDIYGENQIYREQIMTMQEREQL